MYKQNKVEQFNDKFYAIGKFSIQKSSQFSHLYFTALQQGILNISLALPTPLLFCPPTWWGEVIECTLLPFIGVRIGVWPPPLRKKERWNERNKKLDVLGFFTFRSACVYGSAAINNPTLEAMWTNPYLPLLTIWTLLILESNSFQTDRQINGQKVSISQTILYGNSVLKTSHLRIKI